MILFISHFELIFHKLLELDFDYFIGLGSVLRNNGFWDGFALYEFAAHEFEGIEQVFAFLLVADIEIDKFVISEVAPKAFRAF